MAATFEWDFAGTGLAAVADLTGNGRGFTPTGNTVRTAPGGGYTYGGALPNAIGLTQSAADIQVGPSLAGLQTTARTVCGWAKIATSYTGHFMEYYRNPSDDTGVWTWLYLSGTFRARAKNAVGGLFERNVTPNTAYRFYAMTHDGANLKVYQDNGAGTLAQVGADVAMPSAVWTADVFRVFDQSGSAATLSHWRGFDTALTLAQLQALMTTLPSSGTTPVTATRATTWRVRAAVSSTRATTWRVRAQVAGTRATTWRVRSTVTGTRATTWRVRSVVTATRATTWAVASTLAAVTATRATTWTVKARTTATRVVVWDTRAVVTSTRVATWDVLTRTTATRAATWDTLARATAARSTTWRVLARPTASRSTSWAVEVIVVEYEAPDEVTATPRSGNSTATPLPAGSAASGRGSEPSATARQYESTATVRSPE